MRRRSGFQTRPKSARAVLERLRFATCGTYQSSSSSVSIAIASTSKSGMTCSRPSATGRMVGSSRAWMAASALTASS